MNVSQRLARRRRASSDVGFTLVELLIVVVLLGMVTSALSASFVTAIRASSSTRDHVNASNDAQLIASYLIRDAQSTGGVNPSSALVDTTLGVSTSDAASCGAGDVVVRFKWREFAPSTVTHVATWAYDATDETLVRTSCAGATTSAVTLAAHLDAKPTASCDPDCSGLPDAVSLHVTSPYPYTLTAAVRPEHEARPNGSNSSPAPLLALGGGPCTALSVSGTPGVTVYGDSYVNAADGIGCTAMTANGSITYTPGGQYIVSGGTCSGNRCPAFTSYSPPLTDPYASLAPPALASQPCPATNPPLVGGVYQPGIYGRALALSSDATFAPGIYVFCAGISITGGTISDGDPGGVLFYLKGGTFSSSGNAEITLHGYADDSSEYYGLLLWQPNSTTVSISGTADQTLEGTVYAPDATVSVSGTSGTKRLGSIVAQTITFAGTNNICVGACPANPLAISAPSALPAWTVNADPYPATQVQATGGVPAYGWSATGLPAGMTIDAATGTITGTPTTSGSFTVTVTVTDAANFTASRAYTLSINTPPTIVTSVLPDWTINRDYFDSPMSATNGTTPYTWSATGLPPGLAINATTGVIVGAPNTTGTYTPTVTVTDAAGVSASRGYTVHINPSVTISAPASLPNWTVNRAYPSTTVTGSAGTPAYTWSASGLPPGMTINATSGVIAGTPTAAGTYNVTVTVRDTAGDAASRGYTIVVNGPPVPGNTSLANGEVTVPYSVTLTPGSGGTPPYTWSATGLPPGLTVNGAGVISGTPTTAGTFGNVVVTIRDAAGATASRTYTIVVAAVPTINGPASLRQWTVNRDYPETGITATGGTTPYTWSATGLPSGMTINAVSGVITGAPTVTGTFAVNVTLTDANGVTASRAYTLVVNASPTITTASVPGGQQGIAYNTTLSAANGTTPYVSWTASGLPPGLTLNNSGVLAGTPTAAGPYTVTVTVVDTAGASASRAYTLNINATPTISAPAAMPGGVVGTAYTATTMVPAGGTTPYTWSAAGLPAGLTIDTVTGVVSGTPTAAGTFSVTVRLTDNLGAFATRAYTIGINAALAISGPATVPASGVNQPYPNTTITASGGTPPYAWSATGLPAGLSIDPSTGVLSGTPTVAGTFGVTVTVTDGASATVNRSYSLVVAPQLAVTNIALANANGQIGQGDTVTITLNNLLAETSICSAWSGTGDQSITNNNQVTVTVTDGGGSANDTLSVSATPCTGGGHFGTLDLGSPNWVTATRTFGGSGNNAKSTITYTAASSTITLRIGNPSGSTAAGVAAQTVVYSPDGGVRDTYGNSFSASTYTFTAQRF